MRSSVLLAIIACFTPGLAVAQDHKPICAELLRGGVFNVTNLYVNDAVYATASSSMCRTMSKAKSTGASNDAEGVIPLDGINIPFKSATRLWQNRNEFEQDCAASNQDYRRHLVMKLAIQQASEPILNAFNTCIKNQARPTGLRQTVRFDADPAVVYYALEYSAPNFYPVFDLSRVKTTVNLKCTFEKTQLSVGEVAEATCIRGNAREAKIWITNRDLIPDPADSEINIAPFPPFSVRVLDAGDNGTDFNMACNHIIVPKGTIQRLSEEVHIGDMLAAFYPTKDTLTYGRQGSADALVVEKVAKGVLKSLTQGRGETLADVYEICKTNYTTALTIPPAVAPLGTIPATTK